MSLLSDSEKNEIKGILDDVVATFVRPITYYKTIEETLILDTTNHNTFFEDAKNNATVTLTQVSGSFDGRILHGNRANLQNFKLLNKDLDSSNQLLLQEGDCRIKVDASGKDLIEESERFLLDGILFEQNTDARPHGLFTSDYYTYYFKRVS